MSAPPAGSLRTSDRPAAGPCVLPPSGAPAAAPARREASLRGVVELAPLDLGDDVGLARRPAAAAEHDHHAPDQPAQPLVLGSVRAGGALAPGAEPRVGGVHLGQLPGAEALGVLGREGAGVHRSLPSRGPFRHPTLPVAGNPRAAAARVGAADPSRLHPQPSAPVNPGPKPARTLARDLEAEAGDSPGAGRLTR